MGIADGVVRVTLMTNQIAFMRVAALVAHALVRAASRFVLTPVFEVSKLLGKLTSGMLELNRYYSKIAP
jgi:hypothetical protein